MRLSRAIIHHPAEESAANDDKKDDEEHTPDDDPPTVLGLRSVVVAKDVIDEVAEHWALREHFDQRDFARGATDFELVKLADDIDVVPAARRGQMGVNRAVHGVETTVAEGSHPQLLRFAVEVLAPGLALGDEQHLLAFEGNQQGVAVIRERRCPTRPVTWFSPIGVPRSKPALRFGLRPGLRSVVGKDVIRDRVIVGALDLVTFHI